MAEKESKLNGSCIGEAVLLELSIAAHNALVNEVGMSRAMSAMRPYVTNTAKFTIHGAIPSYFGITIRTPSDVAAVTFKGHEVMFHSHDEIFLNRDNRSSWTITANGCETEGRAPLICAMWCEQYPYLVFKEFGTEDSAISYLCKSLSWGDSECAWEPENHEEDWKHILSRAKLPDLTEEQWRFLTLAYRGENLATATKTSVDACGEQRATELLTEAARRAGARYANSLKGSLGDDMGLVAWKDMIASCFKPFQGVKETVNPSNELGCEISECPLSGSPVQICLQLEAFWNGCMQAMDPNLRFSYNGMMTKGQKVCQWTIGKKAESPKKGLTDEAPPDDPIKRLTNKFIDGEITEVEFDKKMSHLRKHGLV